MRRFRSLSDDELYMLSRSTIESSFEVECGDKYTRDQKSIHTDLLNELLLERKTRDNKNTKDIIDLYDTAKSYLILLTPSGVYYTNQCAGAECLHPVVEGCLIPLEWVDFDEMLSGTCDGNSDDWYLECSDRDELLEKILCEIDHIIIIELSDWSTGYNVTTKRGVTQYESWITLNFKRNIDYNGSSVFSNLNLDEFDAILTYPNSD